MAAPTADTKKSPKVEIFQNNDAAATTRYDNLEWIHLNETVLPGYRQEGLREKLVRKTKENPFVPIGAFATMVALTMGVLSMRSNNPKKSQRMMRFRIGAQGFTVVAILVGLAIGTTKPSPSS